MYAVCIDERVNEQIKCKMNSICSQIKSTSHSLSITIKELQKKKNNNERTTNNVLNTLTKIEFYPLYRASMRMWNCGTCDRMNMICECDHDIKWTHKSIAIGTLTSCPFAQGVLGNVVRAIAHTHTHIFERFDVISGSIRQLNAVNNTANDLSYFDMWDRMAVWKYKLHTAHTANDYNNK